MSVDPIGKVSVPPPASPNTAAVRLTRDQQKLQADLQAKASQTQIAADRAAVVKDQQASAAAQAGTGRYI